MNIQSKICLFSVIIMIGCNTNENNIDKRLSIIQSNIEAISTTLNNDNTYKLIKDIQNNTISNKHQYIKMNEELLVKIDELNIKIDILQIDLNKINRKLGNYEYFPDLIFSNRRSLHDFVVNWYTKQLKALGEPSLYEIQHDGSSMTFRFTYLRTFHNPIAIRVVIWEKKGIAYIKMSDGAGGYEPGNIILNKQKEINKDYILELVSLIQKEDFWNISTNDNKRAGLDGSRWLIEGVSEGRYHIVDRWCPGEGAVKNIGLMLLKISEIKIDLKDYY